MLKFDINRVVRVFCVAIFVFIDLNVKAEYKSTLGKTTNVEQRKKSNDDFVNLQIITVKSLPFAMALEGGEVILNITQLIALDMNERLDIPLLELSEFYFGESLRGHEQGAINRGYRMIDKINLRLQRGGLGCMHLSEQARKFLNNGGAEGSFRCKNAAAVKKHGKAIFA